MGHLDGFNIHSLKDYLADLVKLPTRMVFNVDVKNSFSFFETESKYVDNFLALNNADLEFNGRKVSLEVSNKRMKDGEGSGGNRRSGGGFRKDGDRRPRKPGSFSKDSGFKREGGFRKEGGFSNSNSDGGSDKSFGRSGKSEKKRFGKSRF
jgi:ATP-dependent RNA helicase DeaD